jgi:LmbE family N-acetylglucosaminyl deacetylase
MKVLIISAHPDDEALGLGGTIFRHLANNDEIHWLIVTNVFEEKGFSKEKIAEEDGIIEEVAKRIKAKTVHHLDYPTMELSTSSLIKLIPEISNIIKKIEPEVIYTMNRSDAHSDHRIIFDAVAACTKSFRYPYVKKFIMYETLSETEFAPSLFENQFIPNYYVDITEYLDKKIELIKLYPKEIGEHPFPRSMENVKALATYRGAFAGVKYAEAFQILHQIEK